jgi:hypothetical protein
MTEEEWLNCHHVTIMLEFVRNRTTHRKLRLFACACCRLIWGALPGDWSRRAVELGERHADDLLAEEERASARRQFNRLVAKERGSPARLGQATIELLSPDVRPVHTACDARTGKDAHLLLARQCEILRDIVGNPFRRERLDPAWVAYDNRAVERLARAIYDERRFADLPILADALEDASCDNAAVLEHCRGRGPHVLGCWIVDLVLRRDEW